MKTTKYYLSAYMLLLFVLFSSSCEDEFTKYPTISYEPCEDTNVVADPNIITDFECQSNFILSAVEAIRNPSETGFNKSKFVGKYTDGADAWDALVIDYGSPIDLSTNGLFKIKVKTDVAGTLKVKLEGGSSAPVEKDAEVSGDAAWAMYEFNFSDQGSENHTKLVVFFNAGVESDGTDIYYLDDLFFDTSIDPCAGVNQDLRVISDFECQQNYFLGNPENETSAPVVENPAKSGINTSDFVGEYTDNGTDAWDNLVVNFGDPIDLATNSQLKIKIRSSRKVPLLAKLEGGIPMEIWSSIDEIDKWVEYTFDFKDAAGNGNTKVVLFFNGAQSDGTATDIYYIDDIKFAEWIDPCVSIPADLSIISDFECQQNYHLGGDPAVISVPVVANPNKSGDNTSDFVGEYTDDGTNAWDNVLINFGAPIDLSSNSQLNIKIRSSKTVPLLAKLEGGTAMEIWGNIDVKGEWKNYTFDFSAASGNGNTKLVLFFNGGQSDGTATDIYYVDDIRFLPKDCGAIVENCAGVTPNLSIVSDFDCQQNYHLGGNPAVISVPVVANTNVSCANRSSNVGKYTDNGTEAWDNLLIDFGTPIDLSTNNQLKFKVLSSKAVPIIAKIEGGTPKEFSGNITVINEWAEYSFDFSGSVGANNSKLVLFFNAGESNGTSQDIYYLDNIRFEAP